MNIYITLLSCVLFLSQVVTATTDVCQNVEVSGAVFHDTTNNVYSLHPEIHCNSRPVWMDAAGKHYIYFLLDGFDGWMISPSSCYHWGNFMVSVRSLAETPYEVTEVWREYSPTESIWENEAGLKVRCVSAGNRTIPLPTTTTISPEQSVCESELCSVGGDCVMDINNEFYCKCKENYSGSKCANLAGSLEANNWSTAGIAIGLSLGIGLVLIGFFIFIFIFRTTAKKEDNPNPNPIYTSYKQLEKYLPTTQPIETPHDTAFKYKPLNDEDFTV